jgi:hypothetical protein
MSTLFEYFGRERYAVEEQDEHAEDKILANTKGWLV